MTLLRPASQWFGTLPRGRLIIEMSLWSADLARLEDDLRRVESDTDIFHIDVADGHFSPAMLFFPDLVARLRRLTPKPFHVHLMVADEILESQIDQFVEAGADLISIHAENANAIEALRLIQSKGLMAGVVLQLDTTVAVAEKFLPHIDMITLLGTRIGIKGAGLAPEAEERLREARRLVATAPGARRIILASDGGNREHTVPLLRKAGAETVVMGSLAFAAEDLAARMAWARALPAG